MNKNAQEKAKTVAAWPYTVKISKDETTDGRSVFLATHPELVGCMAQGATIEEATGSLKEVTYEYVLSLIEDRLPIPVPSARVTRTTQAIVSKTYTVVGNQPFPDVLSKVVQPRSRQDISTVELVTSLPH